MTVSAFKFEPNFVLGCRRILNQVEKNCKITLAWVRGHVGIYGSKQADELARKAAEIGFIGFEPFCGFGVSNFREISKEWKVEENRNNWQTFPPNSQSRLLLLNSKK